MEARKRAAARRALAQGRCPWCGTDIRDVRTSTTCPGCGNDWSAYMAPPDPGTPRLARIASVLALVLILVVAALQQMSESPAARAAGEPPTGGAGAAARVPAPSVQFELTAKLGVRVHQRGKDADFGRQLVEGLERQAGTPEDRLRVAIVAGDVLGEDEARTRLADLSKEAGEALQRDIGTVLAIYDGEADPDRVERLIKGHGWFGRLASTYGLSMTDPDRHEVAGGGGRLIATAWIAGGLFLLVVVVSLSLFIMGIVSFAIGTLRPAFVPPSPGGSVAIETVAVFVAGFIGLKVAAGAIEAVTGSSTVATVASLVVQWSLVLVLLWPVLRGVSVGRTLEMWGLRRGPGGVLREIGCGIAGYLAVLPLMAVGVMITLALIVIYQAARLAMGLEEPAMPENPILEILGGRVSPWLIVLVMLLASLWAPLVEEAVFRGALYRHLRSRWHWLPAGLAAALGFGLMHGYPLIMLGPVISLGFGFALLREWRGSLIASMTAHCLHNTMVISLLLLAFRFLGT